MDQMTTCNMRGAVYIDELSPALQFPSAQKVLACLAHCFDFLARKFSKRALTNPTVRYPAASSKGSIKLVSIA